jgi:5-methyltetrahydrofolate--homocysteine methyltransferase
VFDFTLHKNALYDTMLESLTGGIYMTKQDFLELTTKPLLLDGATGSNLMAAGMPRGVCTETWVLEHKDIIFNLQRAYVEAGSQIIYAPTFGGNRMNLRMHGLEDRIEEINTRLVGYAKEAADGRAYVAGDITTSGKIPGADPSYGYEEAYEMYQEQIRYLAAAGVDLLVAETMINIDETLAAVDAASSVCDLPIICTMTVEADGSIFSGGNAVEAAQALESAGASAVGINCSVGPDQLVAVVHSIRQAVSIPVIAKPNAGMPTIDENGRAIYSMSAKDFARHMKVLTENGASIIGGCCGTTPEFIRETAEILGLK